MPDIPVERRTYFPLAPLDPGTARPCPACGRPDMAPWYLRRDRERRVWRRWVCASCHAEQDLREDESA